METTHPIIWYLEQEMLVSNIFLRVSLVKFIPEIYSVPEDTELVHLEFVYVGNCQDITHISVAECPGGGKLYFTSIQYVVVYAYMY